MISKLTPFVGINRDLSANDLPLGAITDASNVRFREGSAETFAGQTEAYPTAPINPVSAFPLRIGNARYWVALSLAKAYCVTGAPAVWTNITRTSGGDYAADVNTLWNGGILNGVPILNNGIDVPQVWSPVATATPLSALPAWPANARARVMRPYRNFMFALDVTVTSGGVSQRFPHRVKWSHPADPGTVPVSWDSSDDTKDAGEFDLDGAGHVIDALPLRQSLIIYKENSTYVGTLSGNGLVFAFQQLFSNSGMLSADCAVEIDGSHVVLTSNDVIRHDGASIVSVLDKTTRRWLFKNIDSTLYDKCFLTKNVYFNEVWVCFPEVGQERCTKALVYNYKDNTVSFRDLPSVTSGATGLVDEGSDETFDIAVGSIDTDDAPFNSGSEFGAQLTRTMLCAPDRPALVLADSTPQYFGSPIPAFIERVGISLDAPHQVKTALRLRPRVTAPDGTLLNFRLGSHMTLNAAVDWSDPVPFVVGEDVTVDAFAAGRFLAWRLDSASTNSWRLDGLDIEYSANGGW